MPRRYAAEKSGLWCGESRGTRFVARNRSGRAFMFISTKLLLQTATGVAIAGAVALVPAQAQETVKIGLILPMTGGQASTGKQIDNAVKLYMQQKGDTVAGKKIEVILKDDAAVPDNTKRLAQELIVNDKVNFIAGFGVTPAALAAAPLTSDYAPGNDALTFFKRNFTAGGGEIVEEVKVPLANPDFDDLAAPGGKI